MGNRMRIFLIVLTDDNSLDEVEICKYLMKIYIFMLVYIWKI